VNGNGKSVERSGRPPAVHRRGFEATGIWVFDLDNTLYPAECNLFAQVDQRMGAFIAQKLDIPIAEARYLQKAYYRQFGTTLSGLMQVHNIAPGPFLDFVHDIDLSGVPELPELRAAISRLPGRKLIFTNGSRRHAERVAEKLGVLGEFEEICSIETCDYVPKPEPEAFDRMVKRHGVAPENAAMFEDLPHNLEAPHDLGMTTVLVHSDYNDHPIQATIKSWLEPPEHVHHVTDDLVAFLAALKLD
jgi:putative hydrolase of the HAD superfamily